MLNWHSKRMNYNQTSTFAKHLQLLLIVLVMVQFSSRSLAQGAIPSVGVDFWYGYMHNSASSNHELRLFISSQVPTTGTVDIPLQGWSTTFSVVPNVTTTVIVPTSAGEAINSDVIESKGIHVTTADSVSLFAINFATYSADASKILPKQSLGTDYLVSAYQGHSSQSRSELLIVATEDNTQIEITPSVMTQGMQTAGVPFILNIDAGEVYQLRSFIGTEDLTGTRIVSTAQSGECRPFAVFAGAQCANVPSGCMTCDHLFDQLIPVETWGTEYYVVPYQTTGTFTYRVIARDNGTLVSLNGATPVSMTAGQVLEFNNVTSDVQVVGNKPIQVVQFMQGDNCSLNGDPAMLVLNANDQKIDNVTFSTVSSTVITNHYVNIIVETADVGNVLLDNVPIPASNFTMFGTNPLNSFAQIPLTQGSHNLQANNGLTAYIYGMGSAESYSYSVGSFQSEPLFVVDTTICTADSVVLSTPVSLFNSVWVAQSDTSTIIGTGNNLVMYPPIPTDIYSVTGNSLVSGCPVTYNYSISAPAPPTISVSASEDTVCMFNTVQMNVNVSTPGTWQYEWSPAYMFDDPTSPNPTATIQQSGWYSVAVSNVGVNCSAAEDSVYVLVQGGGVESVSVNTSSNALCLPDSAVLTGEVNQLLINEDFEGGIDASVWSSVLGETIGSSCGSVTGDALLFNGSGTRRAETVDFNLVNGGSLSFYLKVATGTAPCDDAEIGEDVILEYSINGGATWTLMATLLESNYPTFTYISMPVPAAAQTGATRFRWSQPNFSGANQDVWMLENINISASNSGGVSFSWSPTAGLANPNSLNTTAAPSTPTWYVLTVGQGQCTYADSVFIDVNSSFTLTTTNDTTICSGQQFTVSTTPSAGSGYTYLWEPVAPITSPANTYFAATLAPNTDTMMYVTVTSPLGCVQTDSVHVTSVGLTLDIVGDTVLCVDESTWLEALVSNPNGSSYTIEWMESGTVIGTTDSIFITPTSNTSYSVIVDDLTAQCQWFDTVNVFYDDFFVDAGPDTTLCSTAGYQMLGSSNVNSVSPQIIWTNPATLDLVNLLDATVMVDTSAQYVLTVGDGFCEYSDTMNLMHFPPVGVYMPSDTTICQGDSIQLDFSGVSAANWNTTNGITNPQPSIFIISPQTTQVYFVDYVDTNGCPGVDTMIVNVNLTPSVSLPADIEMCEGNQQTINATINNTLGSYLWNTGDTTTSIQVQAEGTYWVDYTTTCGTSTDSIEVAFFPDFDVDLGNDTLMCFGYTLDVTAQIPSGGNAIWSTGQTVPTISVTSPSVTSVSVYDANGCLRQDTIEVMASPPIQVDLGPDISMCEYDSSTLNGTSPQGVAYLWNTAETTPTIVVQDAGTYFVTVTDAVGCMSGDTIVVVETPTPDPTILGPVVFCSNEEVQFEASSGFANYVWSSGSNTNPMNYQGITNEIWVQVTDANGCVGADTINVDVIDVPVLDLGPDIVLCESEVVVLNAETPGASGYLWSPTDQTSPSVDVLPGSYSVVVNYENCTISDEIDITVEPYEFDLGEDLILCYEQGVFLAHSLYNIDSIIWHDGTNASWFEQLTYSSLSDTLIISATAYGCDQKQDTVIVLLEDCNCQFYVPNSFTPNNDQLNDVFSVYFDCPVVHFELSIFNRWGELVFQTDDPNFVWDGQLNSGEDAQDGVYTWKMRYENKYTNLTREKEMHGHVNVLR